MSPYKKETFQLMSEPEGTCEVCRNLCNQKCSQCKLVYYCSSDHQKEDWKNHKKDCFPFEISSNNELGRFVIAKRDIEPGDVVFIDTPLVSGPKPYKSEDDSLLVCVGCSKYLAEEMAFCPECCWPVCSLTCEGLKVPHLHGLECQILKFKTPTSSADFRFDILIVLRALFLQKTNTKKWDILLQLEDHLDDRGPDSDIYKSVYEKVTYIHDNYVKPLKDFELESGQTILPQVSNDIIHKIYAVLDVNATEMSDAVDMFLLYPTVSLLEHNCVPNTSQTMDEKDGYKITFRAALPIKKGDHVTTTYTNILWGTQQRRKHLKESKYFWCTCQRCADPTELETFFSALVCLGTEEAPCKGIQLPINPIDPNPLWVCNKCGIKLPNEEINQFVEHLNKEVESKMEQKPNLQEMEEFMGKLEVFLHPSHFLVYTIKHSLVQMYKLEDNIEISNSFLTEKLNLCQELIVITKKLDPGNARLSLYLAVLLNEQFMSKFKALTRNFDSENQPEIYAESIKELLRLAEEGKESLRSEGQCENGRKLLAVIETNEARFKQWLKENKIEINATNGV